MRKYRELSTPGRQTLHAVADALGAYQADLEAAAPPSEVRQIPLYRCPAAAGLAAPVFGEDFDYIDVTGNVPRGAELAVRHPGGLHGALDSGWLCGLRQPRSSAEWGCRYFLRGWSHGL